MQKPKPGYRYDLTHQLPRNTERVTIDFIPVEYSDDGLFCLQLVGKARVRGNREMDAFVFRLLHEDVNGSLDEVQTLLEGFLKHAKFYGMGYQPEPLEEFFGH